MGKKIVIISTSLRADSNSDILAEAFAEGAREAGHDVEKISLSGRQIAFCRGCLACQKTKHCVIRDDADEITRKMEQADVLAFATPIYYYEMSGQMKTMLDRSNPLYVSDYKFRDVYFLATAAEDGAHVCDRAVSGLEGWIACFEHAQLSGVIFGGGVTETGEIRGHESVEKAYSAGKNIR
jgi:multimeric flavodoxin WrbA